MKITHNKRMQRTAKPLRALSAADAGRYELLEIISIPQSPDLLMKKLIIYISIAIGAIISTCVIADGGISAGGEVAEVLLITAIGWMFSSIYLGIVLKTVTGKKRYIIASPFIPWLSILVMIVVAGLFGALVDSLFRINSSTAESIGLFTSLVIHILFCTLVIWKVKQKIVKQVTSYIVMPMVLASYIWLELFVI